jgi:hypothetical protein
MAWLGETVEAASGPSPTPRCVKDVIEERLFERRRDLFTDLSVVFMDTVRRLHGSPVSTDAVGSRPQPPEALARIASLDASAAVDQP